MLSHNSSARSLAALIALGAFSAMPQGLGQQSRLDPRVNRHAEVLRPVVPVTRRQRREQSLLDSPVIVAADLKRSRRNGLRLRAAAAGGFGAHPFI
jgi:hypothetical protein